MALRINVFRYNGFRIYTAIAFLVRETGSQHLALALVGLMAGCQADEIRLDYAIVKILYRLNYLDFYFVDIIAMLLIVLEVYFSLLFSIFRVCFVVCKVRPHFFHVDSYY